MGFWALAYWRKTETVVFSVPLIGFIVASSLDMDTDIRWMKLY